MIETDSSGTGGALGLGLIGCGDFGAFCMETYGSLPGIRPVAVADVVPDSADRVARRFDLPALHDPTCLIERPDVQIVHLATPPSTHHSLATAALRAGKHVLCEKPLATTTADADEMIDLARRNDLIIPVNFVLRYNAVTDAVKAIIESGALGACIHGSFENYAGDEKLGPNHWFWNPQLSGGIFIEHGVHFFDLYAHWLGPARIVSAHSEVREGSTAEDRVMCTARHDNGVTVFHYHGFDQPSILDRQNHHFLFERGDLYVYGWIPESLTLTAAADDQALAALEACCPGAETEVLETLPEGQRNSRGRWKDIHAERIIRLAWQPPGSKDVLYRKGVADLMTDQLSFLADRSHQRRVTEQNGRTALALAEAATRLSHAGRD